MSDHLRISSPISSSPGRPTAIARPAWPWQASPLRSSSSSLSSLEYRPSLAHSSRPICSSGAHGNSTSVSWQSTPRQSQNSSMGNTNTSQEETTQQWTFMVRSATLKPAANLPRRVSRGLNGLFVMSTS